ncbi:MAG: GNAT family N-acetyltransferase [bacterium]|nr:GNAT family N-acetyltransferase [bacterium]
MNSNPASPTGQSEPHILEVSHPGPEFDTVVNELWKQNSRWLGFMPTSGFRDRAERGTLLAAQIDDRIVGYVLFDLPRDVVKIVHLCVDTSYRGRGIARSLVDKVGDRHQDRRGIELACREDYGANTLWRKLGFAIIAERPGRSQRGTLLKIWFRNHGHYSLFTPVADDTAQLGTLVALDFNIVLDLVEEAAPRGLPSQHLLDDWVTQMVDICITDETYHEAAQLPTLERRNDIRNQLEQFPRLPVSRDQRWHKLVSTVSALVSRAQDSDHRHLADTIAGGGYYFVTRDQAIIDCSDILANRFGISVLSPQQLIVTLDSIRSEDRYEPRQLNATMLRVEYTIDDERSFIDDFQNYGQSEPHSNLVGIIREAQATPDLSGITVVQTDSNQALATSISHIENHSLIVPLLRLVGTDRLSETMGRQICFLLRDQALQKGLGSVLVTDQYLSLSLRRALEDEGYLQISNGWRCDTRVGLIPISEIADRGNLTASDIALYEHQNWPLKVVGSDLRTFVIPIRPAFSEQLFDTHSAEGTLFGRSTELGMSREHVYYRSWRNSQGLASPARILWYVSGATVYQSEGHIRAVSQLAEVQVDRPLTLHRRFARLGVYTRDDVMKTSAREGRVMALRFVDTELLEAPVSLNKIREMSERIGKPFVALPSPQKVSEQLFATIYERASRYVT